MRVLASTCLLAIAMAQGASADSGSFRQEKGQFVCTPISEVPLANVSEAMIHESNAQVLMAHIQESVGIECSQGEIPVPEDAVHNGRFLDDNHRDRGVGTPINSCERYGPNTEVHNSFCYEKCKPGFTGVSLGVRCNLDGPCPNGFTRNGDVYCAKPSSYGRGAGSVYKINDNYEKNGWLWYPKCKENFHAVGCCVCSPNCPAKNYKDIGVSCERAFYHRNIVGVLKCPLNKVYDAGLCYPPCPATHPRGVGPLCYK